MVGSMTVEIRTGQVLWYDASRGYGLLREVNNGTEVFLTKDALDAFGLTGVNSGTEMDFDAIEGTSSMKVVAIKRLSGNQGLH